MVTLLKYAFISGEGKLYQYHFDERLAFARLQKYSDKKRLVSDRSALQYRSYRHRLQHKNRTGLFSYQKKVQNLFATKVQYGG
jgi:hypothetical protein